MNRIYRSIWNEKTRTFVAVSELVKCRGKRSSSSITKQGDITPTCFFTLNTLALLLLITFGSEVYALPDGGAISAGSATISSNGTKNLTITQQSQNAAINWQSFNIGTGEGVRFVQPNSNSVALNRVLSTNLSTIAGSLYANGKIFLINPNGILFSKGSSVNVNGLVASTLNIKDSDFMAGKYHFTGTGNGTVQNQGSINADGGYVALLGTQVSNEGTINAKMGTVALAAGKAITLDVAGDGLLNVSVDQGAVKALVQNGGLIQADGGQVVMTAQAAGSLLQTVVNNTGMIEAQTIENHNGTIKLLGDMQSGTVNVSGKLDASAPKGGDGGFVETSAAHVNVANDTRVTTAAAQGLTGSWLIDPPSGYTIAASGGDITGSVLSNNLISSNITILSSSGTHGSGGHVDVNDTVTWSSNTLTLHAEENININTAMNGSGTASLALEYGQHAVAAGNTNVVNVNAPVNLPAGNHFSTKQGSDGATVNYTVINSLGAAGSTTGTDLQGINGNLAGNYALGSNIDASATRSWNSSAGFAPVGNRSTNFTGTFDGLGHTISNLTINRPSTDDAGIFSFVGNSGTVKNVGVVGGSVSGNSYVGGLAGHNYGAISNSYATGAVSGSASYVGGLVGHNNGSTISNSYATGAVSGSASYIGGLVGYNEHSTISTSYATGAVSGSNSVGGLVGENTSGIISASHATGTVLGSGDVGGLVGRNTYGLISTAYATGAVSGSDSVGGLVGSNYGNSCTLSNSYATGAVSGSNSVGGLIGSMSGTLSNSYATGTVSGSNSIGGLVGYMSGTLITSYATGTVSGNNYVGGLAGSNNGTISMSYATGTVTGSGYGHVGGLVGINNSTISNSHAMGSVSGSNYVGGLVGNNHYGTINTSYATGTVMGANNVGGLAGLNYGGTISNSYATGAVTGTNAVGGLVGRNMGGLGGAGYGGQGPDGSSAAIKNSYAMGAVIGSGNVGGLVGESVGGTGGISYGNVGDIGGAGGLSTITNSYAIGTVTGNSFVGGLIGKKSTGANGNGGGVGGGTDTTNSYWNTTTSGQTTSADGTGLTTTEMHTASNFSGFNFTTTPGAPGNNWVMVNVDGTLNNAGSATGSTYPMLASEYSTTISNAHQLQLMAMDLAGSYTLTQNIDASATGAAHDVWSDSTFIPVGHNTTQFTGIFDGLGHTINSLTINQPSTNYVGLFGYVGTGGTVKNVGIVGGTVSGGGYVGGLVGENEGTISTSYATGPVSGSDYVGGLAGGNYGGTISASYATGPVSGSYKVGGLVGKHSGVISSSYATGAVSSGDYAGGLVGKNSGTISTSYATGVVSSSDYGGGLVGHNHGTISTSYATGAVSSSNYAGGLVGKTDGTISTSYATGAVSGISNVGGLVGQSQGSISTSYATGAVSGNNYAGGLVGNNYRTVTNSYATGAVSGSSYVGGLVGNNHSVVANNYATGAVSGSNYVGGLVGNNSGTVSNSYATGAVSGSSYVGGLVGKKPSGTVSNSFWNTTTSGQATSDGGTGLTTTQMQTASNFSGFHFTTTPGATGNNWVMVDSQGWLNNFALPTGTFPMLASEYSTTITNAHQLQLIAMNLAGNYTLAKNIDAGVANTPHDVWANGTFIYLGNTSTQFTGTFDGQNHTISNLIINAPSDNNIGFSNQPTGIITA